MRHSNGPGSPAPFTARWPGKPEHAEQFLTPATQALFASVLPEILELIGQQSKWAGSFYRAKGKRYQCRKLLCSTLNTVIFVVHFHRLWHGFEVAHPACHCWAKVWNIPGWDELG